MRPTITTIPAWEKEQLTVLNDNLTKLKRWSYNAIEFADNMYVDFVTFTATGGLGTSHTLEHGLNRVPAGWIVTCCLSGSTFGSGGAWTADNIILSSVSLSAGATDTVTVMVF